MPRLIIRDRDREWIHEILRDITTVGRSSRNDVGLGDTASSRFHCEIRTNGEGFELVDLGSKNGTRLNGRRVDRGHLRPGDSIQVGAALILFDPEPDSESALKDTVALAPATDAAESARAGFPEEARQEIQELIQQRDTALRLLEINRQLAGELDLKRLLDLIMDTAIELTHAERGFMLLCEGGGDPKVRVSRNLDGETVRKASEKVSRTIAREAMEHGRPVLTSDASTDERFDGSATVRNLNLRSVLCVPLMCRGKALGAVYVDHRFEEGAFAGDDLQWLEILAGQASIALDNVRLFEDAASRKEAVEAAKEKLAEVADLVVPSKRPSRPKGKPRPDFKYAYEEIITQSPKMYEIFKLLDRVTDSDVPVLITGESGTGKELVARAIHVHGLRKKKPFISQNCAAIPATLMESEFFGHVKGSFTGAYQDKKGLFELAHTGTIFLDEIGDMRQDIQTKFLRVLQEGEIRRVGGKGTSHVDVRVISATNRDLAAMVKANLFREDLYYRLNVIALRLPPLRERKEDIRPLVDFFTRTIAATAKQPVKPIDDEVLDYLLAYDWPGNIRELQNEMERSFALSREVIVPANLSDHIRQAALGDGPAREGTGTLEEIGRAAAAKAERETILESLKEHNWVKTHVAKHLGVSRPTLDAKLQKYGITKEFFDLLKD